MKSEEFLTPKGMSVARNATVQCSIFNVQYKKR